MQIYLIGHGAWAPELGTCVVPANVSLRFYCRHGSVFDSSWERSLLQGTPVQHRDFALETVSGIAECRNYVLAHPGGIRSTVRYPTMRAIDPEAPLDLADNAFFAVKVRADNGYWCISLNAILRKVAGAGAITVHWFACREEFADWNGEQFSAWKEAARGMVGRPYD